VSILEDTEAYESWLRTQCEVVEKDLDHKHKRMRKNPFVFLRATYYRWARRIEKICAELVDAPSALCVGDIHLENFGTWRDADGRWVWGVNDFDEAAVMPYAFDLVRLAASVALAPDMKVADRDAADEILEGYRSGLKQPGPALLDEQEIWIRDYVKCSDDCRRKFWKDIEELKTAEPPSLMQKLLVASLPDRTKETAFFRRRAGGGSLGRPRFVVVATWRGGRVVREAKALVASAWDWSHGKTPRRHDSSASQPAPTARRTRIFASSRMPAARISFSGGCRRTRVRSIWTTTLPTSNPISCAPWEPTSPPSMLPPRTPRRRSRQT
jgi:hypothetical protein